MLAAATVMVMVTVVAVMVMVMMTIFDDRGYVIDGTIHSVTAHKMWRCCSCKC